MKKIFFACILIAATAVFTQCKKKKDDTVAPTYTKTEMLAGTSATGFKAWINTKYISNGVDITSSQPACIMDNILQFYRNGSYYVIEGATKCNSTDSDTIVAGSWVFNVPQDSIILSYGASSSAYKLNSLSTTTLELKDDQSPSYVDVLTYTAQ